ncbi:rRNA maturation RNase YbeY [Corynebacterium felinum]|uniref:Endoribonuclease YbeY n=1 Tax=Corynebacterium felinum TaxID=131318 RepID=A0ABU2B4F3_9CORY|nr:MULTISPECIES: rRNA maturation RNase YbeY [Corynebacterium]MDF5821430.1 rRNA maturation RNase YbeY [Corynebacterium felinum]MDO4762412.1 rRNA maturation RNase YbeY [Corynebacterium sp.]MDR7353480.1 putative rRNA maturation factor [Corynebacterium felinum]WJY95659.1 Endoribonuclease YbeY [Corynebacterium felinum]
MTIEVVNESGFDGVNEESLIDVARFVLKEMDVHPEAEATISVVDVATMSDLHMQWMDLEGPTDVMSFPMDELTPGMGRPDAQAPGPQMLGDIILCPEFALKQAEKAGHDLGHELCLLTTHGCLHLLGYDHIEPAEEQEMFALQNELLRDWYADCEKRGIRFQPKPSGPGAFPSAAQRAELDEKMQQ